MNNFLPFFSSISVFFLHSTSLFLLVLYCLPFTHFIQPFTFRISDEYGIYMYFSVLILQFFSFVFFFSLSTCLTFVPFSPYPFDYQGLNANKKSRKIEYSKSKLKCRRHFKAKLPKKP